MKEQWRQQAACRGGDIDVFFPTADDDAAPARAICKGCPVRAECLEWALSARQVEGIWGGLTESERRRLRRRRRAAARVAA